MPLLPCSFARAGFALVGPFAAIDFTSEQAARAGSDIPWGRRLDCAALAVTRHALRRSAFCLLVDLRDLESACAGDLTSPILGTSPPRRFRIRQQVFTTPAGRVDADIVGNFIGLPSRPRCWSSALGTFPLLVDREVRRSQSGADIGAAVAANPVMMAVVGLIVAALLVIGSWPLFSAWPWWAVGSAIRIGNIYRKVSGRANRPCDINNHVAAKQRRYAAQFPARACDAGGQAAPGTA